MVHKFLYGCVKLICWLWKLLLGITKSIGASGFITFLVTICLAALFWWLSYQANREPSLYIEVIFYVFLLAAILILLGSIIYSQQNICGRISESETKAKRLTLKEHTTICSFCKKGNDLHCDVRTIKKAYNNSGDLYPYIRFWGVSEQGTGKHTESCFKVDNKTPSKILEREIGGEINKEYTVDVLVNINDGDMTTITCDDMNSPSFKNTLDNLSKQTSSQDWVATVIRYPTKKLLFNIVLDKKFALNYKFIDDKKYKYPLQTGTDIDSDDKCYMVLDVTEKKMKNEQSSYTDIIEEPKTDSKSIIWEVKNPIVGYTYVLFFTLGPNNKLKHK